jgi:tetratricopeptide (TPR) repeat protein
LRRLADGPDGERGTEYARRVRASETLKGEMAEVDALARDGRFDDALAILRRAQDRETPAGQRSALERAERNLAHFRTIAEAVRRANRGETAAARAELEQLLAARPEPPIRADAERLWREIGRHEELRRAPAGAGTPPR